MQKLFFIIALTISIFSNAQSPITVSITGNIFNSTEDTIKISQFFGSHYIDFIAAKMSKNGDFSLKGKLPNPDYYVVRLGKTHVNIIIRDGAEIKVFGDGTNISEHTNIVGSEESSKMNEFIKVLTVWNKKQEEARAILQQHPEQSNDINASMQKEYTNFQSVRQQFIANNPNSAALLAALSSIDAEREFAVYESIVNQLNASFPTSPTIKEVNNNFNQIKAKKEAANIFAPGKLAPDFTDTKTDGKTMKLSDLRGQVVLLDFWASWCGPCRRENPNVVKLYEKYNKDGFTVMSVSLDQDKEKWLAAIQADHLVWPNHVSDLKGWQSATGRMYQVSGIPFTVLIDKEGKIIRTNLRGVELEAALQQIFGH